MFRNYTYRGETDKIQEKVYLYYLQMYCRIEWKYLKLVQADAIL